MNDGFSTLINNKLSRKEFMMKKRNMHILMMFVVILMLLAGCDAFSSSEEDAGFSPSNQIAQADPRIISEGRVEPNKDLYLYFTVPGKVADILIEKGDEVEEGQVLIVLDGLSQAEAALDAAELEYQAAEQALDDLNEFAELDSATAWLAWLDTRERYLLAEEEWDDVDKDKYEDDIDDAQEDVVEAEEDLEDAQETFERYEDLDEDNSLRKKYEDELEEAQEDYNEAVRVRDELVIELERVEAEWQQALQAMEKAQQDYEATLSGPDPDKLTLTEARVAIALAQVEAKKIQVDNQSLVSPFSGTIVDVNVTENESLETSKWAILLANFDNLYVETTDLTELEVVSISVGQKATLIPDALPDVELTGEVVEISDKFQTKSGDVLYDVRIVINDPGSRLRWGMTVEIEFEIDE
jgi:HlyD family secretion protein